MTQQTNFCRQLISDLIKDMEDDYDEAVDAVAKIAIGAKKFVMPVGGRIIDDMCLKALDDATALRLPFPVIALEYFTGDLPLNPGEKRSSKRIILAWENEHRGTITVLPVCWSDDARTWMILPTGTIDTTGFLNREMTKGGRVGISMSFEPGDENGSAVEEVSTLLCFLNALQCSNVEIDTLEARKAAKKAKSAFPFDSYHVLTITTEKTAAGPSQGIRQGRSPREHLRRGHIRRLETGKKIWVNAAVVNAGVGGKVVKDYQFLPAKEPA